MGISTGNIDSIFFSRSYALFELKNLAKMKDTTQNSFSSTPLKKLNRISWNFVVMKVCIFAGNADLIFLRSNLYPFLTLNWTKLFCATHMKLVYQSDCPSLMHVIAIRCIQHSLAMSGCGVYELAQSFFHLSISAWKKVWTFIGTNLSPMHFAKFEWNWPSG